MGDRPLRAAPGGDRPIATAAQAAHWVGGRLVAGPPDRVFLGVACDSRAVEPGDLFVALVGERVDGHRFIGEAAARGAVGALVAPGLAEEPAAGRPAEAGRDGPAADFFWIEAEPDPPGVAARALPADAGPVGRRRRLTTTVALGRLAAAHRRSLAGLRVVAITGSVGKTSVKDLLAATLARRCAVLSTQGNWNTEVGVPLTLLCAGPSTEVAVLETAMRGPGQIAWLAEIAGPDAGCVTNVGPSHAQLLGSVEAVAAAKGELVEALGAESTACLNAGDRYCREMAGRTRARVLWFGEGAGPGVRAEGIRMEGPAARFDLVVELVAGVFGDGGSGPTRGRGYPGAEAARVPVVLEVPGRHQVPNALAAAACAVALGLDPADIAPGLAARPATGMRLEVQEFGPVLVVNDAYNASPASARAALEVLAAVGVGRRRVAVLGDMLELGPYEHEAHREVGRAAVAAGVARLVTAGTRARAIADSAAAAGLEPGAVAWTAEPAEAPALTLDVVRPGDAVLVKASRGLRFEAVVQALRERWGGAGDEAAEQPEDQG